MAGTTNTYAVYAGLSGTTWESPTPRTLTVAVPALDPNAPVTTAAASPVPDAAGWNSSAVTVTLSATDVSGVAGTYYTTNGSIPTAASTRYTAPFTVSATATVRFFSVDKRGNAETPTALSLKIDTAAPTGAVTAPAAGAVLSGTVTVTGTSADTGGSGLAGVQPQVQQGSGAWTNLGGPVTTGASTWSTSWVTAGLANGAYALRAVVTDVAGNATTTAVVPVTVQNATLTVTAPAAAVAGTSFSVTIRTVSTVSGTKAITVTGLQSSPNGTSPTLRTSAYFSNGVATISLTATRSGAQSITVRTTSDGRQGTSAPVVVAPKAQGQLYFTSCSGSSVSCAANSKTASTRVPRNTNVTFVIARRATDDYGNSLLDAPVTVTLKPSSGTMSSTTFTLATGVATSGTLTYTPPNSTTTRTIEASGATTGVATAKATLTVRFS